MPIPGSQRVYRDNALKYLYRPVIVMINLCKFKYAVEGQHIIARTHPDCLFNNSMRSVAVSYPVVSIEGSIYQQIPPFIRKIRVINSRAEHVDRSVVVPFRLVYLDESPYVIRWFPFPLLIIAKCGDCSWYLDMLGRPIAGLLTR
jgi:hypothetical protein